MYYGMDFAESFDNLFSELPLSRSLQAFEDLKRELFKIPFRVSPFRNVERLEKIPQAVILKYRLVDTL